MKTFQTETDGIIDAKCEDKRVITEEITRAWKKKPLHKKIGIVVVGTIGVLALGVLALGALAPAEEDFKEETIENEENDVTLS